MVKRVERFQPQFERAATSFAEDEALEHREVPVVTPRATYPVVGEVTPRSDRWVTKTRGGNGSIYDFTDPLLFRMWGDDGTGLVGTVVSADTVATLGASQRNVER